MHLTTFFKSTSAKQITNLHPSFVTDNHRDKVKFLTKSEIEHKAQSVAMHIAGDDYDKHTLCGVEDQIVMMRESRK